MLRTKLIYILLTLHLALLFGQDSKTISGYIFNTQQEKIRNATIQIEDEQGTVSRQNGFFSIVTSQRKICLVIDHTRYQSQKIHLDLTKDTSIQIILENKIQEIEEVIIEANKGKFVKNKTPGMTTIQQIDVKSQPSLLGIPDVISTLQRGTGIQSVNEGISGIYVRGGDAGQNLIIYDHIELVDPSHLLGTYSAFNPYLVESVDLYKGNAPIEYSGRLSSSIIVNSFENSKPLPQLTSNVGTLASTLAFAHQKEKSGIILGIRRTQLEIYKSIAQQILPKNEGFLRDNNYFFYDHNGKVYYHTGNRDRISLSWYIGADQLKYTNQSNFDIGIAWQNKGTALHWKHSSDYWAFNSTLGLSNYSFNFNGNVMGYQASFITASQSIYLKNHISIPWQKHLFNINTKHYYYHIQPQNSKVKNNTNDLKLFNQYIGTEHIAQLADSWSIHDHLSLYISLGLSNYWQLGPQTYTSVQGQDTSISNYTKGETIQYYPSLSPQLFINWERPNLLAYKWSYSYNTQNIHRGSLASLPLPADIWTPSTKLIRPETAHQLSFGIYKSYKDYDISAELYGRWLDNILLFETNLTGERKNNFDENFKSGQGYTAGLELLLRKNTGPIKGTIAYTLAKSQKRMPCINNNQWFDSKYDRIHDLSITADYQLNKRWDFSLGFILASGNKTTVPAGRYLMMGYIMNDYTAVNDFRMPLYHRLDLSANYHFEPRLLKESSLNFSIINAYNRKNTYFFFYEMRGDINNKQINIKPKQFSLFPILPTVSWLFTL